MRDGDVRPPVEAGVRVGQHFVIRAGAGLVGRHPGPWTGLPDFGTLTITYLPDRSLIELKSLKYYLTSFRNVGILQEHAVNRVLNDLVALVKPQHMRPRTGAAFGPCWTGLVVPADRFAITS